MVMVNAAVQRVGWVEPSRNPQEPEFFMGGGGLYSTGPDYLKFVRMFLNRGSLDGKMVLRPETVAMMGQNQIGDVNVRRAEERPT